MTSIRLLVVSLAVGTAVAAAASCKATTGMTGTGASGGASSSSSSGATGGASGVGGTGGADAGPITCKSSFAENIDDAGPCDLLNQDCPPGQTCEPKSGTSGWTTACVASPGLKSAAEDCYSDQECEAKLVCVGASKGHAGKCVAFCCPATNEPCNGGICNLQVSYDTNVYATVCSYGKKCELLTANACPSGYDCHIEAAAGTGVAICIQPSPSPVPNLGTCHYLNDCGDMQECFGLPNPGTCLYYCALTGPKVSEPPGLGGCPMGQTCQASYEGQPIDLGVSNVGLCVPESGVMDAGHDASEAGAADAGPSDAGEDASSEDAGSKDAGSKDAGSKDAGNTDAGGDAGEADDAGPNDAAADG